MGEVFCQREYPKHSESGNAAFWCNGLVFLTIEEPRVEMFHVEHGIDLKTSS